MLSLRYSGMFSRLFLPQRIQSKNAGMMKYTDKIIVANLSKFMRLQGATAEEITEDIDLSNKTCLITGGTNGIGAEIVRVLMKRNCKIAMACRNPYKAHLLAKAVWGHPENLACYTCDLGSLTSVKRASEEILQKEKQLDIVILNAAVFGIPWKLTEDNIETTVQVNYISQYFLLMNIQRLLTNSARIVVMSSESHRFVKWSQDDVMSPTKETISTPKHLYSSIKAYNISKVCGLLALNNLGYQWAKTERTLLAAHPGSFVKTNLCTNWWVYEALYTITKPFSKTIPQAAATPLFCATRPELQNLSVVYFKDCKERAPSPLARDNYLAFRIAELTDRLIEETVGFVEEEVEVLKIAASEEPQEVEVEDEKAKTPLIETEMKPAEQKQTSQDKSREEEQQVVSA